MSELIVSDDGQLGRVERAIAALQARPQTDRMRLTSLLRALELERMALQCSARRRTRRPLRFR
jgi:hypothetical protein